MKDGRRTFLGVRLPLKTGHLVIVNEARFVPKKFHNKIGRIDQVSDEGMQVEFLAKRKNLRKVKVTRERQIPIYDKRELRRFKENGGLPTMIGSGYASGSTMVVPMGSSFMSGGYGGGGGGGMSYYPQPVDYKTEKYHDYEERYDLEVIDYREGRLYEDDELDSVYHTFQDDEIAAFTEEKPNKRGGVLRKMPRIFRYAIYAGVVTLVWKFVNNIEAITQFLANIFVGGVK